MVGLMLRVLSTHKSTLGDPALSSSSLMPLGHIDLFLCSNHSTLISASGFLHLLIPLESSFPDSLKSSSYSALCSNIKKAFTTYYI